MKRKRKNGYKVLSDKKLVTAEYQKIVIYSGVVLLLLVAMYVDLICLRDQESSFCPKSYKGSIVSTDSKLTIISDKGDYVASIDIRIFSGDHRLFHSSEINKYYDEDLGALYIFDFPHNFRTFPRNAYKPTDLVFVREDNSIARIASRATSLFSIEPTKYLLELPPGFTNQNNIRSGYVIEWF
jgi:uncharacterized membrane protein (UPF0127 family)